MTQAIATAEMVPATRNFGRSVLVSLAGHVLLVAAITLIGMSGRTQPQLIIAAGGESGGQAIDVGIANEAETRQFLALTRTGSLGEQADELNTERVSHADVGEEDDAELSLSKRKDDPGKVKTDRPVSSVPARPYSRTEQHGASTSSSAMIGPHLGQLGLRAGIGVGPGGAGPGGIPGGSDYGRRLQQALIGYYRYSPSPSASPRFVIARVTLSRTGRVLSVRDGRLDPMAFLSKSGNPVIDSRAEAALLELDRNPIPFPPDFLPGVREAVAEIYFQY